MNDFAEVQPVPDSAFSLPPDSVAFFVDHEEQRTRLTTFFRFITSIPPIVWVALWGIAAGFATIWVWFVLVFTAKFPAGIYDFLVRYYRYYAKVYAYMYLATDKFPGFSGEASEPYAAHLLIGPPKDVYSRVKVFFRMIIYIPFYIVASVLTSVAQVAAFIAWFAILFMGRQPRGLQDLLVYCLGFNLRTQVWVGLLTEDWPKFSDDEVNRALAERGYVGTIPPGGVVSAAPTSTLPMPPAPPTPPAPPAP
jgi:hypothetical protein